MVVATTIFMMNRILSLIGLQGTKIIRVIEYSQVIYLWVAPSRKTADCPICHKRSFRLHDYRPPSTVKHLKLGSKQIYLVITKRRFSCSSCHRPFMERLALVRKWQRQTIGLEEDILEALREMSFASITRRYGTSYQTQVKLLTRVMRPFEGNWSQERYSKDPFSLGIDEHSFSGHDMCLTITNLTSHRLKSILPDDRKATLDRYLANLPDDIKSRIDSVCIDMKPMYKLAVQKVLPQAKVVIDHFHLIYDANHRIDEERRIIQNVYPGVKISKKLPLKAEENLDGKQTEILKKWFTRFPDLKFYWHVKENLRELYRAQGRKEAEGQLNRLIGQMYKERDRGLTQWASNLEYWKEEILAYFDHRITNAYTEGIHTKLKLIKRTGFGFRNKEVYIRKAALACLPVLFLPHFS